MSIYLLRYEIKNKMQECWPDFYAQYTTLRPCGYELAGPCPLHKGDGPNFKVEPRSGHWYCHSQCGCGGDGVLFIEKYHGTDYGGALQILADWLHLTVPDSRPFPAPKRPISSANPDREVDGDILPRRHLVEFQAELAGAPKIIDWLWKHRGLTLETLHRFQIGLTAMTFIDLENEIPWKRVAFPVFSRHGFLTNIRKHMFAFDEDLNRTKLGKTHPFQSGLPADLFPLQVLWGPGEEPVGAPLAAPSSPNAAPSSPNAPALEEGAASSAPAGQDAADKNALVRLTDHILLVEGEADALLANQMGFPALTSTLGAGGWRPQNTKDLVGLPRLTILYDNDDAGRKGAKARALALAQTVPDIRIATLPSGMGKDLTEWVVDGGATAEDLAQIIAEAVPQKPPAFLSADRPNPGPFAFAPGLSLPSEGRVAGLPAGIGSSAPVRKPIPQRIVDLADVPAPPSDLPFLWGAFLNEGVSHWLTGRTGLGKSTFAFNLACALAEGRTLWGIECRPRRILYVDMESGDIGRALKVQRLYQDRPRPPGRLLFVREPMRLPEESAELVAYTEAEAFDLIIFDTARRVFSVKDENDNAEVYNRIIPTLDALKVRGIATLTMGHPPKNGGLGARGAGAQEDAGDVNLLLTMHRGEVTDSDGIIALSITKNRLLGLGQPPLYLKRIGRDQFERVDNNAVPPAEDTPEKQSPRDRCRLAVLALLDSNGGKPVAYKDIKNAMEAEGHAAMTLNRALKDLLDDQEVMQPTSGHYVLYDPFA